MLDQRDALLLGKAAASLKSWRGSEIPSVQIARPDDPGLLDLTVKIISKLSALLANYIEYEAARRLNSEVWSEPGLWERQDPGFPDLVFRRPTEQTDSVGIEVKTWMPLATEITARYKNSLYVVKDKPVLIALVAWLPSEILYGSPKVFDIWTGSAESVALARDAHYNDPPDYLVIEPNDTTLRTSNLQQTDTNGYKIQETDAARKNQARDMARDLGLLDMPYSLSPEYQAKLRRLQNSFKYRLETNFSKIDRIGHPGIESFKRKVLNSAHRGRSLAEWQSIFVSSGASSVSLEEG